MAVWLSFSRNWSQHTWCTLCNISIDSVLLPAEKGWKLPISPLPSENQSLLERSMSRKKLNVTFSIAQLAVKLDFCSVVCLDIHEWRSIGAALGQRWKGEGEIECQELWAQTCHWNTGASRVGALGQTDGSRRKRAHVRGRRFEEKQQRQDGGSCRDGWTDRWLLTGDGGCEEARCKVQDRGGFSTAISTWRCRSRDTIINLEMAAVHYYVPVINGQEKWEHLSPTRSSEF